MAWGILWSRYWMVVLLGIFCQNNLMAFWLMHHAVVRAICGKMSLPRFFPEAINFWQALDHQKDFFTLLFIHDPYYFEASCLTVMTDRALYIRLRAGLRDKELEEKQLQLLLSGWKALKPGGYLVYHAWVQNSSKTNKCWPNELHDRNWKDLKYDSLFFLSHASACLIASNLVLLFGA